MANGLQVQGLSVVIARLERLSDAILNDIDDECKAAATEMNAEASDYISTNAADQGELLGRQQVDYNYGPRSYLVYNDAPYAAYVHFGTGAKAMQGIHPEWTEIAAEWKNKPGGTFSDFVTKIAEWLTRHGGDPTNAEYVCFLILANGLKPRPFLQVAYDAVKPLLLERVNNIIQQASR